MTERENILAREDILARYADYYDKKEFLTLNEEMSYGEYLQICRDNPALVRNSFQYVYDMIMEKGTSTFERYRKTYTRYHFFDDKETPIFGIDETLEGIVDFIHGAAGQYGTERRVLLLHGPVGSSKSTIARRLKRGLEKYSRTNNGKWFTFKWVNLPTAEDENGPVVNIASECMCPMNENPIKLMPLAMRNEFLRELNKAYTESASEDDRDSVYPLGSEGDLNPRCKLFLNMLLKRYKGDWLAVMNNHIRVVRRVHSEIDRVGIGTFQPKDEKNQDSTELTGDMDFSKIGYFGSDSDPRAFNFDGEFQVANRGVCEMIEMLKLDNAFLYDLLGVSQEHQIKPKKFSQVVVDEFIISHSVHGSTPIPHEYDGVLNVLPIEEMKDLDFAKLKVFSVNVETREVELCGVKSVFSHKFTGEWVENHQDGDCVVTTPNHSVYNKNYETFYPGEDTTSEMLAVEIPDYLVVGKPTTKQWDEFFSNVEAELASCT